MLGYGQTDKPKEVEEYKIKLMVDDIAELFDHEKLGKIVAVAHDWYNHNYLYDIIV